MSDDQRAREFLEGVLSRMGIEASIDVREEPERIVLDVRGPEAGLVIGKKGQTLDALQYLVARVRHRGAEEGGPPAQAAGLPVVVDAEGYRARRIEQLVETAHRLADKAIRTGRTVTVNPMSPHDRRIIHITLDKEPGVTTRSEGEGAFRRLLIIPQPDKV